MWKHFKYMWTFNSFKVATLCAFLTGMLIAHEKYGIAIIIGIIGLLTTRIWFIELELDMLDSEDEE